MTSELVINSVKLAIELGIKLYEVARDWNKDKNPELLDLLASVNVYNSKLSDFRDYLQNKPGLDSSQIQSVEFQLGKDVEVMKKCKGILEARLNKKKGFAKFKDSFMKQDVEDLSKSKAHIDNSIQNLAYLVLFEKFAEEMKEDPVLKKLREQDAKNFWIQRIGAKEHEISIGMFTTAYFEFVKETLGWKEDVIPKYVMQNIVKATIGNYDLLIFVERPLIDWI